MNRFKKVSFRLKGWDYRKKASYFITICTKNRQHYFGKIENKKMILSNIGVIADILWHEIKNHTNNIKLDEFVVMPNHIHGILIIDSDSDSVAPLHATATESNCNGSTESKKSIFFGYFPKSRFYFYHYQIL
jgi:REP element-mobilizing transposase RayT